MKNNYLPKFSILKGAFLGFLFVFSSNNISAQNDYSVTSIPFQQYTATTPVQGTSDDMNSPLIPLTFDFDFFGTTYSQVVVSTNGYIDFAPASASNFSPWQFSTTIPDASFPVKNSILGCYHDMYDNNLGGTITYAIIGQAPYRKFVVLFGNQSHFQCTTTKSTFQMVLYETLNTIDVQLIDKQVCTTWNAGNAVTGIIDDSGLIAFTPPLRNTSAWTAFHEGWRFQRPIAPNNYLFAKCDNDTDGFVNFNLQVAQNDLLPGNPSAVTFHNSEADAVSQINAFADLNYTNIAANYETIYANVNGEVKKVNLRVVRCTSDYDLDSVATADEDINADTNLANDDTDSDGIANFLDNDDDGDMILTSVEYVFPRSSNSALAYLDTDNDGILNYLDNDDDGDGVLTINEDYNHNNDPSDDDTNTNSIPDYLDNTVALGVNHFDLQKEIVLYPNPASTILNIENKSGTAISNIAIYAVNGTKVKDIKSNAALQPVSVADLQSGMYFVKVEMNEQVFNYKFVKK